MLKYKVRVDYGFEFKKSEYPKGERYVDYECMQHMRRFGYGVPISLIGIEEDQIDAHDLPDISKAALKLIKDHDIPDDEVAQIMGSGKDGSILKSDVQNYLKEVC